MEIRDRKLTILRCLSQESEAITLAALLEKLESIYPERSMRRWLNELAQEGLVEKSGRTKNAKYRAIKGKNSQPKEISSCFSSDSLEAIKKVQEPFFLREPVAYNDQWLEAYEPNQSSYLDNTSQLREAGKRASDHDPAGTYAYQIFNRLLIDLSYNSSRLEGNTYSLLDTERLLLHGDSPEGKLEEERVMILNHKEALRHLVENASKVKVTSNEIFTLHYLLADGLVEAKYAGKVRDHAVRIGSSTYMPYEDPRKLEFQLNRIVEKAAAIEEPFEQSFFLLVHISYLQAFSDVNKRTARLSANIPLITQNWVPLSFNDVEVDDYMYAMIAIYEFQDIRPLRDLFVYTYLRTCAQYDATVKSIGFDEVRVRYRQQRRAVLRSIIEKLLAGEKMHNFIEEEASRLIPEEARELFSEDVREDLELMDESRLVGLGVTPEQLARWKNI